MTSEHWRRYVEGVRSLAEADERGAAAAGRARRSRDERVREIEQETLAGRRPFERLERDAAAAQQGLAGLAAQLDPADPGGDEGPQVTSMPEARRLVSEAMAWLEEAGPSLASAVRTLRRAPSEPEPLPEPEPRRPAPEPIRAPRRPWVAVVLAVVVLLVLVVVVATQL